MDSMAMNRRSFLRGLLVVTAATVLPAATVKALEIVKPIPVLYGDGISDDTAALQAFFDGEPFRTADGFVGIAEQARLSGAMLRVSAPLRIGAMKDCTIDDCVFEALPGFEGCEFLRYSGYNPTLVMGCLFCHGDHETFHGSTKYEQGRHYDDDYYDREPVTIPIPRLAR